MSPLLRGSISPLRFSDEIILEIFENLTDSELLSLALISKHIHDLALLSYLSRYGITETDIAANSFPQLSTSGAFPAFRIARFITGVDALRLRFDPRTQLDRDLDFLSRPTPRGAREVRQWDMEGLVFTLISEYHSRPAVTVSPFSVSIIRPQKPRLSLIRRIYSRTIRRERLIQEDVFRQELIILPLMRPGGIIPSISLRSFDAPAVLGTLIVFRASGISDLRFPSMLRLSPAEATAILENLTLPLLRGVEGQLSGMTSASLHGFLCRHPTLERLTIRGPASKDSNAAAFAAPHESLLLLPPDALPRLEHILGSAPLIGWILSSANVFSQLTVVAMALHKGTGTQEAYHSALRGLARRRSIDTLSLQIYGWYPWDPKHFSAAAQGPERDVPHLVDLRLTFRIERGSVGLRNIESLVAWLELFTGVRKLSVLDSFPQRGLSAFLQRKCPHIAVTTYQLGKE